MPVGVEDGLFLRVADVFLEGVEDDGVVAQVYIVPVQEDGVDTGVYDVIYVVLVENGLAVNNDLVPLDVDYLTGVFIHEVLVPCLEDAGSELGTDILCKFFLGGLHLACKSEDVEDVLVTLESDGPEEGSDGKLLLPVDVGVHDIVDVGGELYP